MPATTVRTNLVEAQFRDLLNSDEMKEVLGQIGEALVAYAKPHTGIDTSMLYQSMSHRVVTDPDTGTAIVECGSAMDGRQYINPKTNQPTETYAVKHWITTTPWTKAINELGLHRQPRDPRGRYSFITQRTNLVGGEAV